MVQNLLKPKGINNYVIKYIREISVEYKHDVAEGVKSETNETGLHQEHNH